MVEAEQLRMFRAAMTMVRDDRIEEIWGVKSMLREVIDQIEQKYRQEGRQEGLHEGRRTDALRMLRKGYPLENGIKITELSRQEITRLAEQVAAEKKG